MANNMNDAARRPHSPRRNRRKPGVPVLLDGDRAELRLRAGLQALRPRPCDPLIRIRRVSEMHKVILPDDLIEASRRIAHAVCKHIAAGIKRAAGNDADRVFAAAVIRISRFRAGKARLKHNRPTAPR